LSKKKEYCPKVKKWINNFRKHNPLPLALANGMQIIYKGFSRIFPLGNVAKAIFFIQAPLTKVNGN